MLLDNSVYPDKCEKKNLRTAPTNRADLVSPQKVKCFERNVNSPFSELVVVEV